MGLDCLSPKGQVAIAQQHAMAQLCSERWHAQVIETPSGTPARVDALFARDGTVVLVAEIKARDMTLDYLVREKRTYMITAEKLDIGGRVAHALSVPFVVVAGLCPKPAYRLTHVCWWLVSTAQGQWALDFETADTPSKANIHGGFVLRENAYLPVSKAHWMRLR